MCEEFSGQVKVQLALRAGHRCSVCGAPTGGPHSDQERGVNIGVAAHITAASPLFTPHDVHHGLAKAKREQRAGVLATAFARHPERFPRGLPRPKAVPSAVWINPSTKPTISVAHEKTMTRESRLTAIVDPGRPYFAALLP